MTLVTPGNLFLEKVFEAIPLVDLEVVKVSKDGPPDQEAAKAWQVGAKAIAPNEPPPVVVFHHKVPDVLPPCPVFVIEPERRCALGDDRRFGACKFARDGADDVGLNAADRRHLLRRESLMLSANCLNPST